MTHMLQPRAVIFFLDDEPNFRNFERQRLWHVTREVKRVYSVCQSAFVTLPRSNFVALYSSR